GSAMPVLMNAFGSMKRMCLALQVDSLDGIAGELLDFMEVEANTLMKKLKLLPKLARLGRMFPKEVSRGPCQEVVLTGDDIDLGQLPVLTCWPGDGGPFITLPAVFTRHPETGRRNVGMYRLQVYDAGPPACTSTPIREGPSTTGWRRPGERRCPWRWPSAPT